MTRKINKTPTNPKIIWYRKNFLREMISKKEPKKFQRKILQPLKAEQKLNY